MEQLKAHDFTSKEQVDQFVASGVWRLIMEIINRGIEEYRDGLEAAVTIDEVRICQASAARQREFLDLPNKILNILEEENKDAEREQSRTA